MEFSRKSGLFGQQKFAVGIVFAAQDQASFGEELRQAKAALLEWFAKRGKSGDLVQFTVAMPFDLHGPAEATLRQIHAAEKELSRPLQQRTIQISFLDGQGQLLRELTCKDGHWESSVAT